MGVGERSPMNEGTTRMMNIPAFTGLNKYTMNRGLLFGMSLCIASVMLLCSVGLAHGA